METGERRRAGVKKPRKGEKQVKALTAEEEARRREVVKERYREKLEPEKRALKIVERLLQDSVAEDFLIDCANFLLPSYYRDATEERSIAELCGYPICPNKLGKMPTQKYIICTKSNKVYDITERKCFCSNFCYKASKEFELQISSTPLWLRQHESLPEIKLMKKGESGKSGKEVMLSARRLAEEDIEDPLAAQSHNPLSSQRHPAAADIGLSENSDNEQEQDFVSSVASLRQGPRVHWGVLPKRTDEDEDEGGKGKTQTREGDGGEVEGCPGLVAEREKELAEGENRRDPMDADKELLSLNTVESNEERLPEGDAEPGVEEATSELSLCTLSETVAVPPPVCSPGSTRTQADRLNSPPAKNSDSAAESKHLRCPTLTDTNQHGHHAEEVTGLNITQVGVSKRGAAGLRMLLKNRAAGDGPDSIRLGLLESLERTLTDWRTDATTKFLRGTGRSPGSPFSGAGGVEEEELDEDDLDDEVTDDDDDDAKGVDAGVPGGAPAATPDFETLRMETQQLELRVREFYNGTWVLPEAVEERSLERVTVQDQSSMDPVLPLVDAHAQHLIQKRITVEKLTSCLRDVVGSLCLTMSDISTDLNDLVRTFRFTNTNIVHKTPEWTLIAIVLLRVLSEMSPVVQEALAMPASVEYLNTLMKELGLQERDLRTLVGVFKTPAL